MVILPEIHLGIAFMTEEVPIAGIQSLDVRRQGVVIGPGKGKTPGVFRGIIVQAE
jgi:hypothetical protein